MTKCCKSSHLNAKTPECGHYFSHTHVMALNYYHNWCLPIFCRSFTYSALLLKWRTFSFPLNKTWTWISFEAMGMPPQNASAFLWNYSASDTCSCLHVWHNCCLCSCCWWEWGKVDLVSVLKPKSGSCSNVCWRCFASCGPCDTVSLWV